MHPALFSSIIRQRAYTSLKQIRMSSFKVKANAHHPKAFSYGFYILPYKLNGFLRPAKSSVAFLVGNVVAISFRCQASFWFSLISLLAFSIRIRVTIIIGGCQVHAKIYF